jgi:hypothetical protein
MHQSPILRVAGAKKANNNQYASTVLLPNTPFPLRADAAKREHLFHDRCTKDLYHWQVRCWDFLDA